MREVWVWVVGWALLVEEGEEEGRQGRERERLLGSGDDTISKENIYSQLWFSYNFYLSLCRLPDNCVVFTDPFRLTRSHNRHITCSTLSLFSFIHDIDSLFSELIVPCTEWDEEWFRT